MVDVGGGGGGVRLLMLMLFFSCCIIAVTATTDPTDVTSVKAIFQSLNSPPQLGWPANGDDDDDPCGQSWKGITCSANRVTQIQLSNLALTGTLAYGLQGLTSLTTLDMSNNNLVGTIPYQLPPNVQRLNFAYNNLTGTVPYSISNLTSLTDLNLNHNQLQQALNVNFQNLTTLSKLDLSSNSLTGDLPQTMSSLSGITTMYLQNNQFTGTVDILANLPLNSLNVENNNFTGWIPERLKNIDLQMGGNAWSSGPAPPPPPGTPPVLKSNQHHKPGGGRSTTGQHPSSDTINEGKKSGIGGGGIAGIVISIIVVGAIVAFFLVKRKSKKSYSDLEKLGNQSTAPLPSNEVHEITSVQTSSMLDLKKLDTSDSINIKPPPIDRHKSFEDNEFSNKPTIDKKIVTAPVDIQSYSIADLQITTGSFNVDHLVDEGSFGRVYRAQFDDGKVLAVKKIDSSVLPNDSSEDFIEIVSNISYLHHPNVTELVGYCSEHGQHLLVYEFHKNGSLHDFLHVSDEYSKPLIWNSRVKIALGTARALEYLHEVCSPSVVHKNIKSANILLDAELNPYLSDCGLANYIPNAEQILNHNVGSGYDAPEVALSGQYTFQSDVYSFGVVMLELLSGRKPFDSSRARPEQSLVRWATPQLHDIDALAKMVDPKLKGLYPVKSLSRFADVIALCVQPEPEFRPPMSEVVQALVRLVQRANMSRRTFTFGSDHGGSLRGSDEPAIRDI
ncbi:protein STRUBBELIG-RECEPTOR FAMILY 7-like isoform X2 [Trifolium pratense]|nr:protein STRUBBELIG-RECEPTOR FAMILY 7-like isoform X2 [Trifolium pratense]